MLSRDVKSSAVVLLIANLIPLFGVLFGAWDVFSYVFIYWVEAWFIAFFALLRVILLPVKAKGCLQIVDAKVGLGCFPLLMIFLITFLFEEVAKRFSDDYYLLDYSELFTEAFRYALDNQQVFYAINSLFLSHAIIFTSYVLSGEHRVVYEEDRISGRLSKLDVIMWPALKAWALLMLIIGIAGQSSVSIKNERGRIAAGAVLISIKTSLNLWSYLRESRRRLAIQQKQSEQTNRRKMPSSQDVVRNSERSRRKRKKGKRQ
jgi:hypothetical protein